MPKTKFLLLALFLIILSICWANFTPGTWLTGWDNLHPEFDFLLNIKRSIFSVWQEYQGVGLLAGMGHAADLPRQIFLWISSLVLPTSFLRYFWTYLMLIIGPIGVYFFAKKNIGNNLTAFLGAIFYLLNLGTIQYFFVPFEPYSTFWGFLPWEILVLTNYLQLPNKKNLFKLILINILAVPQGYVQTIFLVYLICAGVFLIFRLKKQALVALASILIINSFWLLPTLFFSATQFNVTRDAIQNLNATEKFFLMNKKRGTIADFIYLKEFYYDFPSYSLEKGKFEPMMNVWQKQFAKKSTQVLLGLFFIIILLGFLKKNRYRLELSTLFAISSLIFLSDTFLISEINTVLRSFPLIDQLFRNPFTKFIVPTIFVFSLLFTLGLSYLMDKLKKEKLQLALLVILVGIFGYCFWPVWQGNFISKQVRVKIPQEYFDLFDYFKKQKNSGGRIADFPQSNVWGWTYYRWGVSGSGFLWYGIKQPILDRAFDVWSNYNENYYWEITQAVYSSNVDKLEKLLDKYQIQWILLDKNAFSYVKDRALYFDQLEKMLLASDKVVLTKNFGKISLYQMKLDKPWQEFVSVSDNLPSVGPIYAWNDNDQAYLDAGDYISVNQFEASKPTYFYPFRSLFTGRKQKDLEFGIEEKVDYFSFKTKIPKNSVGLTLVIPKSLTAITQLDKLDLGRINQSYAQVFVDGQLVTNESFILPLLETGIIEVRVPKIQGYYSWDSQNSLFGQQAKSCDPLNTGGYKQDKIVDESGEWLRLTSISSSNCLDFSLPHFSQRQGYLVKIKSRNIQGRELFFSVNNFSSQKSDLEVFIDNQSSFYVIPAMEEYGQGYGLHFDNISIGRQITINDLAQVEVYPLPYQLLTSIKIVNSEKNISQKNIEIKTNHPNESFYKVEAESLGSQTLILSQAYHSGWIAWQGLPLLTKPLEHVMVNNWENGWKVGEGKISTIYIFFWPQLLEYAGVLSLFAFCVLFLLKKNKIFYY